MHIVTDFRARGIIYKSIFRSFCDDLATSLRVYLPFDFPLATSGSCVYFRAITLIRIIRKFRRKLSVLLPRGGDAYFWKMSPALMKMD